jgi:hypothetical protein
MSHWPFRFSKALVASTDRSTALPFVNTSVNLFDADDPGDIVANLLLLGWRTTNHDAGGATQTSPRN